MEEGVEAAVQELFCALSQHQRLCRDVFLLLL